ncbi:acyl-CoA N-acyltransferase [Phlebopus sp. FC_14]|nr:acyl-CoA N-acyltransferase [Phlebopus sp. FC_14]
MDHRYRQTEAPDLFLGAYVNDSLDRPQLIGYVCSTLSPSESLTHASMSTHVPGSSSVCLHAVTVLPAYRREGIGSALLEEYMKRLALSKAYERILLITHQELVPFYQGVGFEYVGPSPVQHGSQPWFEMRKALWSQDNAVPSNDVQLPSFPSGILEALRKASEGTSHGRTLQEIPGGILDVSVASGDGVLTNKYDLLCPRGCRSVILKSGVGRWVERSSVEIDAPGHPVDPSLTPLPKPPATVHWWLVTPSAMEFHNIGFSRPVPAAGQPSAQRIRLLICADCDLGPLGWNEEGGNEFWLACSRVRYAVP